MRRAPGIFWILLIFIGFFVGSFIGPIPVQASSEWFCPTPTLAKRKVRESCWAEYAVSPGRTLCFSRAAWMRWLEAQESTALCGRVQGRWKTYSPPFNSLHEKSGKRVFLTFYSKTLPEGPLPDSAWGWGIIHQIERVREKASLLLRSRDPHGVIRKLLLDERVPKTELGLLRSMGFVHLMSAAGLHLYSLASGVQAFSLLLMRGLGSRLAFGSRETLWFSRGLSAGVWFLAWLLTGMRPGLLRPWMVVVFRQGSAWMGWRWRWGSPLLIALAIDGAVALLRWVQGESWAPGRIHYALAVGGGLLGVQIARTIHVRLQSRGTRVPKWILDHAFLSLGSWIFCALVHVWTHQQLALATPILNFISWPVFGLGVYPALLFALMADRLGEVQLAQALIGLGSQVFTWILEVGVPLGLGFPGVWIISRFWILSAALLSALLLALPGRARRWAFGFTVAAWVLSSVGTAFKDHPTLARSIEQLDVGQGDSALLEFGDGTGALVDVGSQWSLSRQRWLDLLSARGISELRWVALTHLDEDHVGGIKKLGSGVPIQCVGISTIELETERGVKWRKIMEQMKIPVRTLRNCIRSAAVLSPIPTRSRNRGGNSRMSAFWMPLASGLQYLSFGDADERQELAALPWALGRVQAHGGPLLFKISHHGSRYSTSSRLLKALSPREVWISSGIGNHHGHPTARVLKLIENESIPLRRTDLEGAIRAAGVRHQ